MLYPLPKRDVGVAVLLAFLRIPKRVRWVSTESGDQDKRHVSIVTCMHARTHPSQAQDPRIKPWIHKLAEYGLPMAMWTTVNLKYGRGGCTMNATRRPTREPDTVPRTIFKGMYHLQSVGD